MNAIELDDETAARVRFAARVAGVSESEIVARAVRALTEEADEAAAPRDPWDAVEVFAEYADQRVEGTYVPATRRLTVTSGALAGQTFRSPSAAAGAVIAALNPARATTQASGWRFWKVTATHHRLESLRTT